jgi:hypothetical protein
MARIEGQGGGGAGKGVNVLQELKQTECYLITPVLRNNATSHVCAVLSEDGHHFILDPAPRRDGSISIQLLTVCSSLLFRLLRSFFGLHCQAGALARNGLTEMTDPSRSRKDSICSARNKISGCVAIKLEACTEEALRKVAVLVCWVCVSVRGN